jgi:hypothetical protein
MLLHLILCGRLLNQILFTTFPDIKKAPPKGLRVRGKRKAQVEWPLGFFIWD